jgi:RNA polymerase sigma-70 factor, ECF subfamily
LTHPGDEDLLDRLIHGDPKAFPELYDKYSSRLFSYCLKLLRDRQSAEDAVQDTLTKVYSELHAGYETHSFRAWIFTIARNEAFGVLRKKRTVALDDNDDIVWEGETPLESLLQAEESEIVQHLLGELKPEYREVIMLREYENFSYEEIAAISSSTIAAVKSRLFKARKAMIRKLKPLYETRD